MCVWFDAAAARKPDTQPSAPHHTDNLKIKAPNTTGSDHLYNTLELLMMGIMVPETCGASNKFCNKEHLLHLVGILFPHINEDARSKLLQKCLHKFIRTTCFGSFLTTIRSLRTKICNMQHICHSPNKLVKTSCKVISI